MPTSRSASRVPIMPPSPLSAPPGPAPLSRWTPAPGRKAVSVLGIRQHPTGGTTTSACAVRALHSLLRSPVAVEEDLDFHVSAPPSPVPPQTCRLTSWACALVAVIPKALAKDHPVPPKGLTNQVSPALPASPPCGGGGEAGRGKPGRNPDVEES